MVDKIVEGMKNIARKIATGFRSILGINSPSRLFAEYGLNITQGLAVGLDQGGAVVEKRYRWRGHAKRPVESRSRCSPPR